MAINSTVDQVEADVLCKPPPLPAAPPIGTQAFAVKDCYTVEDERAKRQLTSGSDKVSRADSEDPLSWPNKVLPSVKAVRSMSALSDS